MKTKLPIRLVPLLFLALLSTLNSQLSTCFPQGTAFTYQGRLNDNGGPANGTYEFRFKLFTDAAGNNQTGGTLLTNGVSVANGLFTTKVDFGLGIFNGSNLWLEIAVRTNGAANYSTLAPIQALTSTPYAIFAEGASNVIGVVSSGGLSGVYSGAVTFNNAANDFSGSFTGNGGGLTNVNAAALGGLGPNAFWKTAGNSGTTAGANFVGTTDNQPLEFKVNGSRALRLEPNGTVPNVIGGSSQNSIQPGVVGSTISGGGSNLVNASSSFSFIGGGQSNSTVFANAVVGGGQANAGLGNYSAVVGGNNNVAGGQAAFVGAGDHNQASGFASAIVGGEGNQASASISAVVGGVGNVASGGAAFVGGGGYNGSGYDPNVASGIASAIVGGMGNKATNTYSAVGGGGYNASYGLATVVSGGWLNFADHPYATVAGGSDNGALNTNSAVGGGIRNTATGLNSVIAGGTNNTSAGESSAVAGGAGNHAIGAWSAAGGGSGNQATDSYSTVGGGQLNAADGYGATVAGGLGNTANGYGAAINGGLGNTAGPTDFVGGGADNEASANYATVTGGNNNIATNDNATIGGGTLNRAGGSSATVAGGYQNSAGGYIATVAGGIFNVASGSEAVVGGGAVNYATGVNATVPGGTYNYANGDISFAAGYQAHASHNGSFVWADSQGTIFSSTTTNEFNIRSQNGVRIQSDKGIHLNAADEPIIVRDWDVFASNAGAAKAGIGRWGLFMEANHLTAGIPALSGKSFQVAKYETNGVATQLMVVDQSGNVTAAGTITGSSDRNAKENFKPVNPLDVLQKVTALPITEWNYRQDKSTPHIGPMAQDFHAAFAVGPDDRHISMVDADGVALAAIQGLDRKLEEKESEIQKLQQRLEKLEQLLNQKTGVTQ